MQPATRGVTDTRGRPRVPFAVERALTAGLLCGPGGAAAHVAAGGALPSLPLLLGVTALAVAGGALLLAVRAHRLGWPGLFVMATGTQLVFHHLLGAASPAAGSGSHPAHGAMSGHGAGMGGVAMLLAHLGVAVLLAAVARGADASWTQLVRSVLLRLLPHLPATAQAVVVPRPARPLRRTTVVRDAQAVPQVVGPRGPPRALLVTLAPA